MNHPKANRKQMAIIMVLDHPVAAVETEADQPELRAAKEEEEEEES